MPPRLNYSYLPFSTPVLQLWRLRLEERWPFAQIPGGSRLDASLLHFGGSLGHVQKFCEIKENVALPCFLAEYGLERWGEMLGKEGLAVPIEGTTSGLWKKQSLLPWHTGAGDIEGGNLQWNVGLWVRCTVATAYVDHPLRSLRGDSSSIGQSVICLFSL